MECHCFVWPTGPLILYQPRVIPANQSYGAICMCVYSLTFFWCCSGASFWEDKVGVILVCYWTSIIDNITITRWTIFKEKFFILFGPWNGQVTMLLLCLQWALWWECIVEEARERERSETHNPLWDYTSVTKSLLLGPIYERIYHLPNVALTNVKAPTLRPLGNIPIPNYSTQSFEPTLTEHLPWA